MTPLTYFLPKYLEAVVNKTQPYRFTTSTVGWGNGINSIEKKIIRNVEITYIGKKKELFVFHVLTTGVTIKSNRTVQNEKFLKEDIFAFGSIAIGVNDQGEIVKVYNLTEMQNRWNKRKQDLRENNSGFGFEVFFNNIANVLNNEQKTLFFLNSYNMFGLYFSGWFGNNTTNELYKKKKSAILEFDDVTVTEEIRLDNKASKLIITAKKSDDLHKKIISSNDIIIKYEGELLYDKNNQLLDAFLEVENEKMKIKYEILWVG